MIALLTLMTASATAQMMPRLMPGDTIAIAAPSGKIDSTQVMPAVRVLQAQGYHVIVPEGLWDNWNGFAGTSAQRAQRFQQLLDDPTIKVILCAKGGYGAVNILDQLDFTAFRQHPKWICGYSDITALHAHLHTLGFPTLHSIMPTTASSKDPESESFISFIGALRGDTLSYTFDATPENRCGTVTAPLVGGNLSLLYSLLESPSSINTDGKILFIEDVDEDIYHIHRMLVALDRAGKLKNLKGLLVGGMTRIEVDKYFKDVNANEALLDVCGKYDYPICFAFPAGHCKRNLALRLGCTVTLTITPDGCTLQSLPQ